MIINKLFDLTKPQKILLLSAGVSMIVQVTCVYYFTEEKNRFNVKHCGWYIIFSIFSYLFYYKMILP